MTSKFTGPPGGTNTDAELMRLGITREVTEIFVVGSYRYSKLPDAIAEATRARDADNDS